MNDDYKIIVDWFGIKEKYAEAGIDISDMLMPRDESLMIKCNDRCYDDICVTTRSYDDEYKAEIKELKQKLEEAEHANEIMRTDNKAMAEGLVRRDDKIKALEAENNKLKAKIEEHVEAIDYCKRNGIWAECTSPSPSIEDEEEETLHLLDGLELD